jgi:hypothetical protein
MHQSSGNCLPAQCASPVVGCARYLQRVRGIRGFAKELNCGNPAVVGLRPDDRWLCVPAFRRVCRLHGRNYAPAPAGTQSETSLWFIGLPERAGGTETVAKRCHNVAGLGRCVLGVHPVQAVRGVPGTPTRQ